jgi:hypothetical protein
VPRIPDALRVCLLTYRGNPRSGGQGIYVKLLSQALTELGHEVEVYSGTSARALDTIARTRSPGSANGA